MLYIQTGVILQKETNPRMYRDQVELFGQEYADRVIEKLRNAKGPERWGNYCSIPTRPGT